ncbi:MAG TPA: tRNA (N6-isopentenyl adenosine(37)-C2)-methylthiotransferase MiaB, partial [Candidatus Marinimicrobia bacterium]|nr:tRNA (N6-isopentenyl adenosine(37)-C2)-methylthiotransferase MiaB [Candidatus Neomarinimicrobiota bacterium]
MSKSYFIETYGCQMNVADSELVSGLLTREGFSETKDIHTADAIFVNTCAIREHAEDKVLSRLG